MLPMKTLLKRVRRVVHDTDAITYDDEEIIDVLNSGIKYIRRTIADLRPELLTGEVVSGVLAAGDGSAVLPWRPLVFLYVRTGDEVLSSKELTNSDKIWHNWNRIYHNKTTMICSKYTVTKYRTRRIPEINVSQIHGDIVRDGQPETYFLTGAKTVNFYPIPTKETKYEILAVQDIDELTINDDSPLQTEYDDILVEYANVRLSIENEYDVSADSQVLSNIYQQIVKLLHIPPKGVTVQGYWGRPLDVGKRPFCRGAW